MAPSVLVGLGNPGSDYERTRHNIGFMAVDALADRWRMNWQEKTRFHGWVAHGSNTYLLKPNTFMNLSGQAVQALMHWLKRDPGQLLVIYDDLDLPLGKIRLRLSGSAGGHNGMKSIISHLGTEHFARLRIGIGRPTQPHSPQVIHHVLGMFTAEEQGQLAAVLKLVCEAIDTSRRQGLDKAMNLFNHRLVTPSSD
ncbi:MAG: aminoacyl-tRNA hydrolase [Gloeomargaritaceae cyanobacterium C42_A2020_066]|nr:aminoacyl-tRNA hydrolase [Gloeomargaritaceae cyanobacterium C42_A2020_066]